MHDIFDSKLSRSLESKLFFLCLILRNQLEESSHYGQLDLNKNSSTLQLPIEISKIISPGFKIYITISTFITVSPALVC